MFSLLSIDAKNMQGVFMLVLCGIAGFFLFRELHAQNGVNNGGSQTGAGLLNQVEQLSLMQSLFSGHAANTAAPAPAPAPASASAVNASAISGSPAPGSSA
jgi:hypothetical protein